MKNKKQLYHYKPLSSLEHFTQLQNYINQKVWFTRLDQFNDPFEAKFNFKYAEPAEILENSKIFDRYYSYALAENPQLTKENFRNALQAADGSEGIGRTQSDDGVFKSHGVICFAKDNSNIPMWAHYANNHRGYCVVFEFDLNCLFREFKKIREKEGGPNYSYKEFSREIEEVFSPIKNSDPAILSFNSQEGNFIFTKVVYKDEKPTMKEVEMSEIENANYKSKYLTQHSFGIKFKQWEYEEEYRLIVNSNSKAWGLTDLIVYEFIKITGIILGQNVGKNLSEDALNFIRHYELCGYKFKEDAIEKKVQEFVKHLAYKRGVNTFLASCSQEKYEINIEKI